MRAFRSDTIASGTTTLTSFGIISNINTSSTLWQSCVYYLYKSMFGDSAELLSETDIFTFHSYASPSLNKGSTLGSTLGSQKREPPSLRPYGTIIRHYILLYMIDVYVLHFMCIYKPYLTYIGLGLSHIIDAQHVGHITPILPLFMTLYKTISMVDTVLTQTEERDSTIGVLLKNTGFN